MKRLTGGVIGNTEGFGPSVSGSSPDRSAILQSHFAGTLCGLTVVRWRRKSLLQTKQCF